MTIVSVSAITVSAMKKNVFVPSEIVDVMYLKNNIKH